MSSFETTVPLRLTPGSKSLDRQAELPPHGDTIDFGMHGAVADHYKAVPQNPLPSTLDYLTASIGGCLIGTFAGSLMRARVPVSPETLRGDSIGYVESDEDGVLVLKRVTVRYRLELPEEHREAAEEVLAKHAGRCPNARSVSPSIEIVTVLEITSPVAA
ncbi:MAG: OsmC family protein [Thermoleophilia bacterium]|nr:OsmC family protein [Thermoleophilia bacterium]MDH3725629.1 OsmC family protein [Thermoleophilia bacterium]